MHRMLRPRISGNSRLHAILRDRVKIGRVAGIESAGMLVIEVQVPVTTIMEFVAFGVYITRN